MFFRRLSGSIATHNLTGALLDLVIVVIGIFLGIQASEWYEGRQEIALEESILQRLNSEFSSIAHEADAAIQFHQAEIATLERIYQALLRGEIKSDEWKQFSQGLDKAFYFEFGPSRSGTYVETLSSGQFRLIRNQAIRTALNRYDDYVLEAKSLFSGFQQVLERSRGNYRSIHNAWANKANRKRVYRNRDSIFTRANRWS